MGTDETIHFPDGFDGYLRSQAAWLARVTGPENKHCDKLRVIADHIERYETEIIRKDRALTFYANATAYWDKKQHNTVVCGDVFEDEGQRARAALQPAKKENL